MQRINYLDGWRGLAILSVLFGHFVTARYLDMGRFGVELFFVLSGRLMAEILFVHGLDLKTFYVRRLSRIYPALLVFATCVLLFGWVGNMPVSPAAFLAVITLTYNYFQIVVGQVPIVDHIWSLCVEEHMYLLLGGLAVLSRRVNRSPVPILLLLAAVMMANGVILTLLGGEYTKVYWRSDTHGASILLSAAIFLVSQAEPYRRYFTVKYAAICGLLSALALNSTIDVLRYTIGTGLLSYAISALPADQTVLKRLLNWKGITLCGIVSYSLYLWQQPAYKIAWHAVERLPYLPFAILAAIISYFFIEKPTRAFLNGLWRRQKTAQATS